jgi:hypothetical protein
MARKKENSMSKKHARRSKQHIGPQGRKRTNYIALAAISLIVTLCLGTVLGPWRDWGGARRLRAFIVAPFSPPPIPSPSNPSKEYIYAGGKLIATEEPAPGGPPPTNLVATAESATTVGLTWTAPVSGVVTGYVVERTHILNVQPIEIQTGSSAPSFIDNSALVDKAYLYRVRAVLAGGGSSLYSNKDLATTVVFTDASLQGVIIKADHLNEARRAVNAVRALALLGLSSWTYPDPVSSPPTARRSIYLEDMRELRTNLNPALSPLEIAQLPDDATLERGLGVKATHLQDVRDKVK